ncbi:DivIVA domain-containing protein [Dactylosporangium sp. NPDC051484]|uniref:DivIVA domain-containing protein n=1 Tax=Dactylosporangium sp. NPDC051484 TaxID=3154942 RepID=UPI00344FE1D2
MSQGQRFRRRAMRRGYKVDEVDSFLDRVEATLSGDPMGAPMSAQEVHDVVFRVRFGGYDEWQVDLHLDRVERQLAELEERGGGFGRSPEPRGGELRTEPPRMPERMEPPRMPDRVGMAPPPPDRMGPPPMDRMGPPAADRMGPPPMDRMAPPPPGAPLPTRPAQPPAGPPPRDPSYGRYDEPTYGGAFDEDRGPYEQGPRVPRPDMTAEIRMERPDPATYAGGPDRDPYGGPPDRDPYGPPTDRDPYGGAHADPYGGPPGSPPTDRDPYGGAHADPYGGPPGGPTVDRDPYGGAPADPYGGPPAGPPVQHQSTEVARIDQLRRTFQLRRFGSGYDRAQVDRLFEGVMASLTGRGGPLTDGDLDPTHFNLVPGGYFEAEVDAALKEVRDIVTRRR